MKRLFDFKYGYFSVPALLAMLCMTMLFGSCSDDIEPPTPGDVLGQADHISIEIKCSEPTTRATEPGKEELNENLIKSVTVCLSPNAGDRTDEDAPVYMQTFTNLEKQNTTILRIPLTTELINRLFNENSTNKCRVFAAVNINPGDAKTVDELRQMVVNSTFDTRQVQTSFTMDGDGTVEYLPSGNYAVGTVDVKRSAAKINLSLDVDDEVVEQVGDKKLTWIPKLEGMRVRLEQGVKTSTLDPRPTPNMDDAVYFNTVDAIANEYKFQKADTAVRYDQVQNVPFYTYPNEWTGSVDEKHGTFMMLSVPWSSDGGKSWRMCYYHVPIIPFDKFELARNISYHVNLHVGVLGSFVPEEPLQVEADYYVADWGQENIPLDIKGYRYLVVDQNEFTVNNENEITIPFYTSHKTKVISTKMTFYRYNFSDQGSEFAVEVTDKENDLSAAENDGVKVFESEFINKDEKNKNDVLTIKHNLVIWQPYRADGTPVDLTKNANGVRERLDYPNAIAGMLNTIAYYKPTTEDEYSAIKFEVTVQHSDVADGTAGLPEDSYQEKITIWQYPGMYITAVQNYCDNLVGNTVANAKLGNTFVNGNATDSSRIPNNDFTTQENNFFGWGVLNITDNNSAWNGTRRIIYNYTNWDTSIGLGNARNYFNWNPNMYLVTITKLSVDNYNIGDPRSYNINNNLSNDIPNMGYTVDGGSINVPGLKEVFDSEFWYYKVGNNNTGPDGSAVFNGKRSNPLTSQAKGVDHNVWNEYVLQGYVSAPSNYGTSPRTLTYYYPTREASDNSNTLAPKFRICSSYAGSRDYMTREMSRRRAAAYQELGYCAGRWRLPTYGEVEFIMKLAAQEKIPRLFGTNSNVNSGATPSTLWYYWCAQGLVRVPDAQASNTNPTLMTSSPTDQGSPFTGQNYRGRTRFVYDEWYWGSGTLTPSSNTPSATSTTYTFTWGDRPKSNPQD